MIAQKDRWTIPQSSKPCSRSVTCSYSMATAALVRMCRSGSLSSTTRRFVTSCTNTIYSRRSGEAHRRGRQRPRSPNLREHGRNIIPSAPNQLWVNNIIYVDLLTRFINIAISLDARSRLFVGYVIGRSIDDHNEIHPHLTLRMRPQGISFRRNPNSRVSRKRRGL